MINCPQCGFKFSHEVRGFNKLSRQQMLIYNLLYSDSRKVWTVDMIAMSIYDDKQIVNARNEKQVIKTQIHNIRAKMGDVIETTAQGYRLRSTNTSVTVIEVTTESGYNAKDDNWVSGWRNA